MEAMTVKTVRDSWNRSVFAVWWWFMLERAQFERVMMYVAVPNSDDWVTCWLMYTLYACRQSSRWSTSVASMSGRTRKKAESKEEHKARLDGYERMERKRKERYDAPLMYERDEDEDGDEWDEKKLLEAERLVEQLQECEDTEADSDENKENRPPHAASSFSWESECTAVQRLAEEAEARKQQRRRA